MLRLATTQERIRPVRGVGFHFGKDMGVQGRRRFQAWVAEDFHDDASLRTPHAPTGQTVGGSTPFGRNIFGPGCDGSSLLGPLREFDRSVRCQCSLVHRADCDRCGLLPRVHVEVAHAAQDAVGGHRRLDRGVLRAGT